MGRVVAIGGGESEKMFRYIVDMPGNTGKNLLFVGTASGDRGDYYARIADMAQSLGCDVRPLFLTTRNYAEVGLRRLMAWADIIYVCGGDTYKMMQVWREKGFDKRLIEAHREGRILLTGSSAGGICWFRTGFSDSARQRLKEDSPHGWVDGLGIYPEAFCPHYASRAEAFEEALGDTGLSGFGLEDDTAFVDLNGERYFVRCSPEKHVVVYEKTGSGIVKRDADAIEL